MNISGRYMKVKEVLDEVMRDIAFYRNSGGGITLSGGEPLMQSEFAVNLLAACKKEGLHTTLDTSGYVPWEKMENVLRFVDLVLFDIKNLDCGAHKRTTGVGNKLILENLLKASKLVKIWIRIPLVANSNDSEEHIKNIAVWGKNIVAERISLLPYHEGGKAKSEQIGRSYEFSGGKAPSDIHINHLKEILESEGLNVSIGS
jgi:pyruvate formate lyase activating enzyme